MVDLNLVILVFSSLLRLNCSVVTVHAVEGMLLCSHPSHPKPFKDIAFC